MELKRYQKEVIDKFELFLKTAKSIPNKNQAAAFAFMSLTKVPYKELPDELAETPFLCVQVPTGGGKTFIASHIIDSAYTHFEKTQQKNDTGLVLWLVPSDAIRTQTLQKLRDKNDPVREVLDERFNNKVVVLDILEARSIKKSDISENITIVVATFASFKREETEGLKVFQNNGALMTHFENQTEDENQKYSVIEVIKKNTPLVIVDEGHNAQTSLSLDMFKDLNPCMIVEFTATPRSLSNVFVSVPATELKMEHMIKMPIFLETKTIWQDAIKLAYEKRNELEKISQKQTKDSYIRPILLIQAEQEIESPTRIYVGKVLEYLEQELKIDRNEIAIRTGKQNEIENKNLFSLEVKIRYIITVDALKEGWDCSFAYVLASVKNLGAPVAVKQLIGRILRSPYAIEHKFKEFNQAYVYASAPNFQDAARLVIDGLKANGYDIDPTNLNKKTINTIKTEYSRNKKGEVKLPLIAFNAEGEIRELDYSADLIGDVSILNKINPTIDLSGREDTGVALIDINTKGDLVREQAENSYSTNADVEFSIEQLVEWLLKKISRSFLSLTDIEEFIVKAVKLLIPKKISINNANRKRYLLLERINELVDGIVNEHTYKQFFQFLKSKHILTNSKVAWEVGNKIEYNQIISGIIYNKHIFTGVGQMNTEEQKLADVINSIESVEWWLRNPEQNGFYIQGWMGNKFRPDFIVKTQKGNYFVLEYKGDQLVTNDDSKYKKELGDVWTKIAGEKYHFEMVEKNEINSIAQLILKN
ncbi:MAG: DEAD/DEAH box helicase family protein [Candidatus Paceibacterota bacterium]|jgi:superfamily II DNA or RNA helicase